MKKPVLIDKRSFKRKEGRRGMEDIQIIELYWQRDEQAIQETAQKYGEFCYGIAKNVLSVREDAEECVNDTYHQVWNVIPPQRPAMFKPWLGKIVRNISINLWNKNHAQKRYRGIEAILSELEDCIPSPQTVESELEEKELSEYIDKWLRSLDEEDRVLFIRRYWYGTANRDLAKERSISPGKLAQRMYWLRRSLKEALEREGIVI